MPPTSYSLVGNTESSSDRLTLLLARSSVCEVNGIADLLSDRWTARPLDRLYSFLFLTRKIKISPNPWRAVHNKKKRLACRAPDQISSSRRRRPPRPPRLPFSFLFSRPAPRRSALQQQQLSHRPPPDFSPTTVRSSSAVRPEKSREPQPCACPCNDS